VVRPNKFYPFVAAVLSLFALLFLSAGKSIYDGNVQFEDGSLQTSGTVVARLVDEAHGAHPGDINSNHRLQYRFTDNDGNQFEGTMYVSLELYERSLPGETVSVIYLPHDPRTNRLYLENDHLNGLIFLVIGGLMMLAGIFFAYTFILAYILYRRLRRDGIVTEGTIAGIISTNVTLRDVPQVRVAFSFRSSEGRSLTGVSDYIPGEPPPPFKSGDKVRVRYLRSHPEVNRLEESPC
jgi:Protein of unknown function (DUF3592)